MKIRGLFTKKKIIWTIIILVIAGSIWYFASRGKNPAANIQTATVASQDLKQTVLSTGQVISQTDLSLSFQAGGVVEKINVAAGANVKKGDVLAVLSQANAQAALVSARGSLAQARANYNKVVAGSSNEQINVSIKVVNAAQVAYNNAVAQLATIQQSSAATINQAQTTLDDLQSPDTHSDNKRSAILTTISGQLASVKSALDKENQILADNNLRPTFSVTNFSALNDFKNANQLVQPLINTANASLARAQASKTDANIDQAVSDAINALNQNIIALNSCFLALQNSVVSSQFSQSQLDAYKSSISGELSNENPGVSSIRSAKQALVDALTAAQNSLTNSRLSGAQQVSSAQNQINSAKAAWQQAEATLAQQKAKAQPADIQAAMAQIIYAQGSVEAAQANLNNLVITAPSDGTVTQVDIKVGEQASAMKEVIVIQDVSSLHAESYVSEANVASLKIGQSIDYTFDALGPDRHFTGEVQTINPASTVISGVVNYLVKGNIPNIAEIKPGMTANLTILVASKNKVLAVPSSAIINNNGQQFIRVVDNPTTKSYHQVAIQTGLQADGGLVEVLSGLTEGQTIVTYIKP